jgi:hypothetical protein
MTKFRTQILFSAVLMVAASLGGSLALAEDNAPGNTMVAARPLQSMPATPTTDLAAIVPPMDVSAAEAREWVLNAGYSEVSPLTRVTNQDGIPEYHGTAIADGERYSVVVDSWGNIAGWR